MEITNIISKKLKNIILKEEENKLFDSWIQESYTNEMIYVRLVRQNKKKSLDLCLNHINLKEVLEKIKPYNN